MRWSLAARFWSAARPSPRPRKRRPRTPLALERLEDRVAPAGGSISGTVYNDLNGNGVRDADETGVAGRTAYLDQNRNGLLDAGERSTTTAADGSYAFTNLAIGDYSVAQVL